MAWSDLNFEITLATVWHLIGKVGGRVDVQTALRYVCGGPGTNDRSQRKGRADIGGVLVVGLGWMEVKGKEWLGSRDILKLCRTKE